MSAPAIAMFVKRSSICSIVPFTAILIYSCLDAGCLCQEIGPLNISRMEGEKDVFISCPFNGDYLPIWEINSKIYELFQIPVSERIIPASRGLLIPNINASMNGTSFRCFYPTGYKFGVHQSSLGVLTVTPKRMDYPPEPVNLLTSTQPIYLDHQNTWFGIDEAMITLKHIENEVDCNNRKIVSKFTCEDDEPFYKTWPIYNTSDSVLIKHVDIVNPEPLYFNAYGYDDQNDECGSMRYYFQVEPNLVTETLSASFTRSEYKILPTKTEDTVYIVFPQHPANSLTYDCPCSIIFAESDQMECTKLTTCSCIRDTIFSTSIEICNSTEGIEIHFENLTEVMNSSRLFFFQNYHCGDTGNTYRKYIASYEILQVLPDPPTRVEVTDDLSEVCVFLNENGIMLDNYEIIIYDVTGEEKYYTKVDINENTKNCSNIGNALAQPECAPFIISAKTNNDYGSMTKNITLSSSSTLLHHSNSQVCSCLEKNVNVIISGSEETESTLRVEIQCPKHNYVSQVKLESQVMDTGHNHTFTCDSDSSQSLTFEELACNEYYNISVRWTAPNKIAFGAECSLGVPESAMTSPCQENNHTLKYYILGGSIGGVALFVLSAVFVLITCYKYIVKPRSAHDEVSHRADYETIVNINDDKHS